MLQSGQYGINMGRILQHTTSKKEKQLSGIALTKAKEKKKQELQIEYETLISTVKGKRLIHNAISKKVNQLCKTKEDITVSIGMLSSEKGAYKKAIEMQKRKINDKATELRNMDKILSELDIAKHELEDDLAKIAKSSREIGKYISDVDVVRDEKASLKQQIGRLKGIKTQIKDSIIDLEKDLIVAKKKQDKEIDKYVTVTYKQADKATKSSRELIMVETELLASIDQLKATEKDLLSKADDEVLALKAEITNLNKEKDLLEGDVFKARKELIYVQKEVSQQKDKLDKDLITYENKKIDILDEVAQMKLKHKLDRIKKANV